MSPHPDWITMIAGLYNTTPGQLKMVDGGHFSTVFEYKQKGKGRILRVTPPNPDIDLAAMRFPEHGWGHIHTHQPTLRSDHAGGDQAIDAGATAYVHNLPTGLQYPQVERVARSGEGLDGSLWNTIQPFILESKDSCQTATGVEVEAAFWFARNKLIFFLDSGAQQFQI
jgi:hypothetical protein